VSELELNYLTLRNFLHYVFDCEMGPGMETARLSGESRAVGRSGQRVTLPALMQEVQTFRRFGVLPTLARTR
jgi:hypothetical protein